MSPRSAGVALIVIGGGVVVWHLITGTLSVATALFGALAVVGVLMRLMGGEK